MPPTSVIYGANRDILLRTLVRVSLSEFFFTCRTKLFGSTSLYMDAVMLDASLYMEAVMLDASLYMDAVMLDVCGCLCVVDEPADPGEAGRQREPRTRHQHP